MGVFGSRGVWCTAAVVADCLLHADRSAGGCGDRGDGLCMPAVTGSPQEFSEADYTYLLDGWKAKVVRCGAGLQKWGLFKCTKPTA